MERTLDDVMTELKAASARNTAAREGLCRAFDLLKTKAATPEQKAEIKAINKEATEVAKLMRKLMREAKALQRGAAS